jgi:radical SAM superfamily enzyme YgiQ (UPF0313 family)
MCLAEDLHRVGMKKVRVLPIISGDEPIATAKKINNSSADVVIFWMERPFVASVFFDNCLAVAQQVEKPTYWGGIFSTMFGHRHQEVQTYFDTLCVGFNLPKIAKLISNGDHGPIILAPGGYNYNEYELDLNFLCDTHRFRTQKLYGYYSSVGCPNNCHFCFNNIYKIYDCNYSHRSINKVKTDLNNFIDFFRPKEIVFKDLNFFNHPEALNILNYVKNKGVKISGNLDITLNAITEELIERLSVEFKIRRLFFGLEAFEQDDLKKINKNSHIKKLYNIVEWLDNYEITLNGIVMFGFPWQTKESIKRDMQRAVDLMSCCGNLDIRFLPYIPLPGTLLQKTGFPDWPDKLKLLELMQKLDLSEYNFRSFPFSDEIQQINPHKLQLTSRNYAKIRRRYLSSNRTNAITRPLLKRVMQAYEKELLSLRLAKKIWILNGMMRIFSSLIRSLRC